MNDFGLPTPPAPIPETPVITPPKKKFPFKIAAGVLMVLLLAAGVFVTDKITLQRQIIESQGKTAKMKPKDVKKRKIAVVLPTAVGRYGEAGNVKSPELAAQPRMAARTRTPKTPRPNRLPLKQLAKKIQVTHGARVRILEEIHSGFVIRQLTRAIKKQSSGDTL